MIEFWGPLYKFAEIKKDMELLCFSFCQTEQILEVALATSSKDGPVSSFNVFSHLKDLLQATVQKDARLSEQSRLQKDISEWIQKLEDCRKEGETKQQQLQVLQNEIEENKAKLTQQHVVLHIHDFT